MAVNYVAWRVEIEQATMLSHSRILTILSLFTLSCFLPACGPTDRDLALSDREMLWRKAATCEGELTLERAIALALQHNLDYAAKIREEEILREASTGERLRLLPNLMAKGEATRRDRPMAATDMDFETSVRNKQATVASDESRRSWNLAAVWNVLDFGIAYFHSRAAAFQASAGAERLRRARQNLALDVTRLWWKAQAAANALKEAEHVAEKLEELQQTIQQQIAEKAIPEIEAREMEVTLTLLRIRLQDLRQEARTGRVELAFLVGLAPAANFILPRFEVAEIKLPQPDIEAWEEEALQQRPEMVAMAAEEMVRVHDLRAQIAGFFPGTSLWLSREGDSNSFLIYNQWAVAGLQVAWDLLSLPRRAALLKQARARREHVKAQRLALAAGILAQVHLAAIEMDDAAEQYRLAKQLHTARERQLEAIQRRVESGEVGQHVLYRLEAETLLAKTRMLTAFADFQVAQARLHNSLGREPWAAQAEMAAKISPNAATPEGAPLSVPGMPAEIEE